MKKYLIMLLAVILVLSGCNIVDSARNHLQTEAPTEAPTEVPTEVPTSTPTEAPTAAPTPTATPTPKPTETPTQTPVPEVVGVVYADPDYDLFIMILESDWTYYKTENCVYFFNPYAANSMNVVSMSSTGYKGSNPMAIIENQQAEYFEMLQAQAGMKLEILEKYSVTVGDQEYSGMAYPSIQDYGGLKFWTNYIMWAAEGRIFTCVITADIGSEEEMTQMLENMLDTFQVLSKMG